MAEELQGTNAYEQAIQEWQDLLALHCPPCPFSKML